MLKLNLYKGYILVDEDTPLEALILPPENGRYTITFVAGCQFNHIARSKSLPGATFYKNRLNEKVKEIRQFCTENEVESFDLEKAIKDAYWTAFHRFHEVYVLCRIPETDKVDESKLLNAFELVMQSTPKTEDNDATTEH